MEAASLKTFGMYEAAARLPSAVMALATMLLVWFLARRMFGDAAGLRAGLVFAVCPLAFVLAREVIFDMTLTFLVTAAMVAFWLAEESGYQKPGFEALMFAAMGLAIITKGFVGILIPLVAILLYQVVRGRMRDWLRLRWGWGLLVLLAVALPWFIAVSMRNPDFPRYAFWNESFKRFTTAPRNAEAEFSTTFPFSSAASSPGVSSCSWRAGIVLRRWRELKQESGRPGTVPAVLGGMGLSSSSRFRIPSFPPISLPAIVPLSILMGHVWQEEGRDLRNRVHRIGLRRDLPCCWPSASW